MIFLSCPTHWGLACIDDRCWAASPHECPSAAKSDPMQKDSGVGKDSKQLETCLQGINP
jgi:hypothetical protein